MIASERFWQKVDKSLPCWAWRGSCFKGGYGAFVFEGRLQPASRVSLILSNGHPSFNKAVARHDCDNPNCVNPDHLRWGTQSENMQDAIERGRFSFKQLHDRHEALRARRIDAVCAHCSGAFTIPMSKLIYAKNYCSRSCADKGLASATHCHAGHEFTPENTYRPAGRNSRHCRACTRERARQYRQRIK